MNKKNLEFPQKEEKEMITDLLTIIKPGAPTTGSGENPVWPFCTGPVFAIFSWLF